MWYSCLKKVANIFWKTVLAFNGLNIFRFYDLFLIIVLNISIIYAVRPKIRGMDGYKFWVTTCRGEWIEVRVSLFWEYALCVLSTPFFIV